MRFYVEAYGCTMNQGETEMIAESLEREGHERVEDLQEADRALIGTCVVIEKTENRMKRRIEELQEEVSEVIVSGCLPSIESREDVKEIFSSNPECKLNLVQTDDVQFVSTPKNDPKSIRGTIPIASGCRGDCSYCITKLARGDLKSRPPGKIKQRFKELVSRSTKEIRLTCQDTALYGKDISTDLNELLRELLKVEGDYRIRVGMMNVDTLKEIKDGFLDLLGNDRIYTFLHLPLQSGSNAVLKRMNRRYTAEGWLDLTKEFREKFPELTLSTDIIVGFPGETEQNFEKSRELLKRAKPDIVNVTRFSPRRNTKAAEMEEKVHSREKKKRSKDLTDLRFKISRKINEGYVGKKTSVLVLEEGKKDSLKARMDNYKVVILKNEDKELIGNRIEVEIKRAEDIYLVGKRI
ncbi:MAG: tRNA (N(6)-L-threonylcarbamoyladenosine(37)-C(2))-methylthiotransferase [Candidatus Thermoplasmatota archaeon]|nr:tRNA (N(6)-L-threonylcarbamoyladenosine(37)-C(2))-methylthiotransferase [Candidatus Thermoplasmatota archaeon]